MMHYYHTVLHRIICEIRLIRGRYYTCESCIFNLSLTSSRIPISSGIVSARSILILVWRKSGIPLNIGVAARCRRVCRMPRFSSIRSTLMRNNSSRMSIFSSSVSCSCEKIHGAPNVARPIITASTPYFSKAAFASLSEWISPLPIIGICTDNRNMDTWIALYLADKRPVCLARVHLTAGATMNGQCLNTAIL